MRPHLLLLVPVLFLGACNVFEGLASDELSSGAGTLVADGRAALGSGKTEEAVKIFEKAIATAPATTFDGRAARLGLASAILQRAGLTVLTLNRLVTDLNNVTKTVGTAAFNPASAFGASANPVCSFGAGETVVGNIDLEKIDGYAALRSTTAVLARAQALVAEALGLSANATRAEIEARAQALLQAGGDTSLLAGALADGAIADIGIAYDKIVKAGAADIRWVVLTSPGAPDRYVGYCAPSAGVKMRVEKETACAMPVIERAVSMIEIRAALVPAGSLATDSSKQAREGDTTLNRELKGTCTPG